MKVKASRCIPTVTDEEMEGVSPLRARSVAQSCPTLAIPWAVVCQTPLSIEFSKLEYWSELPFPSPGDLPNPGIKAVSPALVGRVFTTEPSGKPLMLLCCSLFTYLTTNISHQLRGFITGQFSSSMQVLGRQCWVDISS